jgi:hypothetical protein
MMPRRNIAAAAIVVFAGVSAWVLFIGLPRWYAARQAPAATAAGAATAAPAAAVRKITATLYYVSDDGMALVPAQREVPFGATVVEQARAIIEAQIAGAPPLVSAVPAETKVRDVFITERGDAFVDLSSDIIARHPAARSTRSSRSTPRQRAHGQPAGRHARADPDRRQGSRHARGSCRPAASALEEYGMGSSS